MSIPIHGLMLRNLFAMRNKLLAAQEYFEEALLAGPALSGPGQFLGESLRDSFQKAFIGNLDEYDGMQSLIGVGVLASGQLEIALDGQLICDGSVCRYFSAAVSRKLNLENASISVHRTTMPRPYLNLDVGNAVGHRNLARNRSFGTLGAFVFPTHSDGDLKDDGRVFIVSNNHVLADSNVGNLGDDVYLMNLGTPRRIGHLAAFEPIDPNDFNRLDLAVARLDANDSARYRELRSVRSPRLGELVSKNGARTGYSEGIIRSVNYSHKVQFGSTQVAFRNQIQIESSIPGGKFSDTGDSGSGIYSMDDGASVGLLFAGNGRYTFANQMSAVVSKIKEWNLIE